MEVLSVKDLKFSYYLNETDTFHALQNITFSVEQGEMVLFCGLCGCGKTTLLKLLKEELKDYILAITALYFYLFNQ